LPEESGDRQSWLNHIENVEQEPLTIPPACQYDDTAPSPWIEVDESPFATTRPVIQSEECHDRPCVVVEADPSQREV
jgi:hypothetical protein